MAFVFPVFSLGLLPICELNNLLLVSVHLLHEFTDRVMADEL